MTASPAGGPRSIVLVHGAWGGGWVWRRVADRLAARGHRVFAPTLTGLGDRAHLIGCGVGLSTHVADVANLIRWEGLAEVVLVGHSYAGMVIAGVAEALPRGTIDAILFLDAVLPEDGRALADYAPLPPAVTIGGVEVAPPPPLEPPRVDAADAEWMNRLRTPQPFVTFTDRVRLTGALDRIRSRHYLLATGPSHDWLRGCAARARAMPGWGTHELACGHDVMVSLPGPTADLIIDAAG